MQTNYTVFRPNIEGVNKKKHIFWIIYVVLKIKNR